MSRVNNISGLSIAQSVSVVKHAALMMSRLEVYDWSR